MEEYCQQGKAQPPSTSSFDITDDIFDGDDDDYYQDSSCSEEEEEEDSLHSGSDVEQDSGTA